VKKVINLVFLLLVSMPLVACGRPSITLRVLDEQTREPIEGVVAIAWWSSAHGLPGLTYHKIAEAVERVSGPDGRLTFPGFATSTIPHIKVYKPGYVCWDIFEIYKGILFNDISRAYVVDREYPLYQNQDIYLEPWKDKYSYMSHDSFVTGGEFPTDHAAQFHSAFFKYEIPKKRKEIEIFEREKKQ
jgi:hypothetical protein